MKRTLLALALCLVMVGLSVSPAFASATKVPLFRVSGYGSGGGGDADAPRIYDPGVEPYTIYGYAAFIVSQGDNELTLNLTVKGADKNTKYYVYLRYGSTTGGETEAVKLGTLTTNRLGNWGGQNSQGQFQKVLPPGEYDAYVALQLDDQAYYPPVIGDIASFETGVRFKIAR